MYQELAVLAVLVVVYCIVAGRIERSVISGPIVFVAVGFLCGPLVLGWFDNPVTNLDLRILADLTLAIVLFIDAAGINFLVLERQIRIPSRMLLLGLPGVIALGFGLAVVMFDGLSLYEAAILATMLAATDAALGKAVITNKAVPIRVREGLNVESGLNDGLCVPVLLVFIALAEGSGTESGGAMAIRLVVQELGIGLVVGLGMTAVAAQLFHLSWERGWITPIWKQILVPALAVACFATAQSLHGSGYIAAFTGGMLFGYIAKKHTHGLILAAEGTGETLALMTWTVFGAAVIGQSYEMFDWKIVVYALLSLTVIRVIPIVLSLAGTGVPMSSKLFLGWFGPRGLASIVFAIIVLNANLPGGQYMSMVVVCTVFFSLVAHGVTANPLAKWLGRKEGAETE